MENIFEKLNEYFKPIEINKGMESKTTTSDTTPIYELDQVNQKTPFEKLIEAINNGKMDIEKHLDVLSALEHYIASK